MRRTGKRTAGLLVISIGLIVLFEQLQWVDGWYWFGYMWIAAIILFLAELWLDQKKRFFEEEQFHIHKPSVLFIVLMTVISLSAANLDSFSPASGLALGGGFETSEPYFMSMNVENASEGIELILTNASLTVHTHEKQELVIDGKIKGSGMGVQGLTERFEEEMTIEQTENTLLIEQDRRGGFSIPFIGRQLKLDAVVFIPKELMMKVNVVNGSLLSEDVIGQLDLSLVNGPVTVKSVAGDVFASTTNGRVVMSDITGDITAGATNGDIRLSDAGANVIAETVNGSVSVQSSLQGGDWDLETVNGSVSVSIPESSHVRFEGRTTNGSVTGDGEWEREYAGSTVRENRHGSTVFGEGTWRIYAKSVNGNISLEAETFE